jgi:hypothetical protein
MSVRVRQVGILSYSVPTMIGYFMHQLKIHEQVTLFWRIVFSLWIIRKRIILKSRFIQKDALYHPRRRRS